MHSLDSLRKKQIKSASLQCYVSVLGTVSTVAIVVADSVTTSCFLYIDCLLSLADKIDQWVTFKTVLAKMAALPSPTQVSSG